jgi:lipopolysaccharide/colanic/teichoic acid biosynthesis glycosyltransferase
MPLGTVVTAHPGKVSLRDFISRCAGFNFTSSHQYAFLKTGSEWVVALVMLVLVAPLIAGLAMLVKLNSKGPAFYPQRRLGRFGRPFQIYKLRTMTHRCEQTSGPIWSMADDPRVTRLGRWLRDTHLDELPQLWNVLCGHMSLIGPRPERPEIAAQIEEALPEFRKRLLVRPGITGLAQLRLPPHLELNAVRWKLAYDILYIDQLSWGLDLRIALTTVLHFMGFRTDDTSRQSLLPALASHIEEALRDTQSIPSHGDEDLQLAA